MRFPTNSFPQLDRALARWDRHGKPPELTLLNMLRHGLDMMDIPDLAATGARPVSKDMEGEDIPF